MKKGRHQMKSTPYYELIDRTKELNKRLRSDYYHRSKKLEDIRRRPLYGKLADGMPTESLGPFPEFVLPTNPCIYSLAGLCSPCFFSKVAMSQKTSQEIYDSLIIQTKYIVDHFDDVVLKYQCRKDQLKTNWDITFCFACNGSFFSNEETTSTTRLLALKLLADEIEKRSLKPLVYLETCVGDYLRFIESEEAEQVIPYLLKLNAVISFGIESVNDISRNLIYLKDLSLEDFEKARLLNERYGLQSAAFVFAGFHSMTQQEIIEDVTETVEFLTDRNVMPILMFPNLQEYTLPHLLYIKGRYNLIDPRTVLSIVKNTDEITKRRQITNRDYWLMGDPYGGPPVPKINLFDNSRKCTCAICSNIIKDTLQRVRRSHDSSLIEECEKSIANCNCNCRSLYEKLLSDEKEPAKKNILERVNNTIDYAESFCSEYLDIMASKDQRI